MLTNSTGDMILAILLSPSTLRARITSSVPKSTPSFSFPTVVDIFFISKSPIYLKVKHIAIKCQISHSYS